MSVAFRSLLNKKSDPDSIQPEAQEFKNKNHDFNITNQQNEFALEKKCSNFAFC